MASSLEEEEKVAAASQVSPEVGSLTGDNTGGVFLAPYPGERKTTTTKETWAYYTYYLGCTSLGPFIFAPSMFQTILYSAGYDPDQEPIGQVACGAGRCFLHWAGREKSVASLLLSINGISFAVQVVFFLMVGGAIDWGNLRPWVLIVSTIVTAGTGLGWWALQDPSKWQILAGLYVIAVMGYQVTISYSTAALATLARDTPVMQESERAVAAGTKTLADHRQLDMLQRNKIADLAYLVSAAAAVVTLSIGLGILKGINSNVNTLEGYAALMVFTSALWLLFSVPWFTMEQRRPGRPLPPGTNYLTIIPRSLLDAAKSITHLKQTFLCLIAYFIITDTLTTTVTVVSTLTYSSISYKPFELSAITILGFGTEGISIYLIYLAQKRFPKVITTKVIVMLSVVACMLLSLWGIIGIGTHKFGFRNSWEFFAESVFFGLFCTPWYQVSRTLITELVPVNHLYMFFSLFSVVGQTSSFIGPFVTSAIIDRSNGNTSYAFIFLLPMFILGLAILYCVDVEKSRDEQTKFMARRLEADKAYAVDQEKGF